MYKLFLTLSATALSLNLHAMTSPSFSENADVAIQLSNSNYNRLVVQQDKITKAHFPEGAMAVKGEEDGSLYVMIARAEPFTVFLTTEKGHHFSATVSSETMLGKTIEFVPKQIIESSKNKTRSKQSSETVSISNLITQMMNQTDIPGFKVEHHYGRAVRYGQGLILFPKITYHGSPWTGEVLDIYNGGKKPLDIQESWFADQTVRAVSLSETTLAPKQHAFVYRVLELHHG